MKNMMRIIPKIISMTLLICIMACSFGKYNLAKGAENQWVMEDFKLPVTLRSLTAEYIDGKIYVIGGEKSVYSAVSTLYIYDTRNKSWSTGASMSVGRSAPSSAYLNGKIYVMGGSNPNGKAADSLNKMEIYDINNNTWTSGKNMPISTVGAKSIIYNNKIYVFGGISTVNSISTYLSTIQIYDLESDTWTTETMPFSRAGYSLNLIDDNVYLSGGRENSTYFKDMNIYNITTNTWSKGSDMQESRYHPSSVVRNNKIYVIGGMDANSKPLNKVGVYDMLTDSWSEESSLNTPKERMSALIANDRIYVLGGETDPVKWVLTDKIESLQIPPVDNRLFVHLYIKEKTQLSFTHNLIDNQDLVWKSVSSNVAAVDSEGVVTAMNNGITYITTYDKNGNFVDYIPVYVSEQDEYRMAVHLNIGQTQKLHMKGNPTNIIWYSMDDSVAAVSSDGVVKGVSRGLAIVKAEVLGEEHYIYVRVS